MSEFASTDRLIPRPVSPITEDDQDIFRTFLNGSDEFTLQPLGSSSDVTSFSLRACPYSAEERDVETLPENPIRHVKGLRNLILDWNLELFALISSTVSLSALIILLANQHGKALSTWTVPLSLNTVVSILSVIIKTPLAFTVGTCLGQGKWAWFSKRQGPLSAFVAIEEAGRGPLGSIILMWKLGFRHWVCFGAGITLALLAIDPFLQGLVQYVGEMSQTGEIGASMMRSQGLDVGEWHNHNQETLWLDGQAIHADCYGHMEPDIGLKLATQIGFVNASILGPDARLPHDIRREFNITQKSMVTMMRSLDDQVRQSINKGLSNSTDLTATFDNVARLLSYQMRDADRSEVEGKTEQWVIYIKVRWELISGPVLLLLAATLFSARVVMESRGIELETSKSEPLELLLYGFDAKSRDCLRADRKAGKSIEENIIQLEEAVEGPELRLKEGAK
ncbi:hypothetical protein CEP53_001302 [Fusarium sp. AF-6]|nr:hypothetical protein CEP53_001302 [Fusarium sp. AF-6]